MNDEEFGRAWAMQQGIKPHKQHGSGYGWYVGDRHEPESRLLVLFADFMGLQHGGYDWHKTEAKAFAALGKAVRAIHAAVPQLATPTHK